MRKVFLSLALAGSLFAATQSSDKVTINESASKIEAQQFINEKQIELNEQQGNINKYQEQMNNEQIDTNKHVRDEIIDLQKQLNVIKSQSSNNNNRLYDEKINRVEDKIYRLERTLSDRDTRIRRLESKVR